MLSFLNIHLICPCVSLYSSAFVPLVLTCSMPFFFLSQISEMTLNLVPSPLLWNAVVDKMYTGTRTQLKLDPNAVVDKVYTCNRHSFPSSYLSNYCYLFLISIYFAPVFLCIALHLSLCFSLALCLSSSFLKLVKWLSIPSPLSLSPSHLSVNNLATFFAFLNLNPVQYLSPCA